MTIRRVRRHGSKHESLKVKRRTNKSGTSYARGIGIHHSLILRPQHVGQGHSIAPPGMLSAKGGTAKSVALYVLASRAATDVERGADTGPARKDLRRGRTSIIPPPRR